VQHLPGPFGTTSNGEQLFTSKGLCLENVGPSCNAPEDCPVGRQCEDGSCQIAHGACAKPSDCPSAAICRANLVVVAADDVDGDGVTQVAVAVQVLAQRVECVRRPNEGGIDRA
jgi:hypothetical protein